MNVPAFFAANIQTTETIVETINNGGTAMTSVAQIAGYYAWDAATDNLESDNDAENITENELDAHLDFLAEAGAKFDRHAALEIARQYQAAAVADLHSSDA